MYAVYTVKRTQIYLDEDQDRRLAKRAEAWGTTKSELIRQAVDDFLDREDEEAAALARLKQTVRELYQRPPSGGPSGAETVEEIRRVDAERLGWLDRYWRADEARC